MLVKGHIELVKEATGNEPDKLIFAGGASVSDLWSQILADVTGKPVVTPVVKEATALGAAIIAGYGVGIYPSIAEGAAICAKVDKTYTPNLENKKYMMKCIQSGERSTKPISICVTVSLPKICGLHQVYKIQS